MDQHPFPLRAKPVRLEGEERGGHLQENGTEGSGKTLT